MGRFPVKVGNIRLEGQVERVDRSPKRVWPSSHSNLLPPRRKCRMFYSTCPGKSRHWYISLSRLIWTTGTLCKRTKSHRQKFTPFYLRPPSPRGGHALSQLLFLFWIRGVNLRNPLLTTWKWASVLASATISNPMI